MSAAAAPAPCLRCGRSYSHPVDCPGLREKRIGPPAWKVRRLARNAIDSRIEDVLEACNQSAEAWLLRHGRAFP